MTNAYESAFQRSINDPEGFWAEPAQRCHWYKKWDRVLDDSAKPFYRWFAGGQVNTCFNALDYHIENGRGNQTNPRSGIHHERNAISEYFAAGF